MSTHSARPDGGKLPPYKPGAHIDIHLPNGLIRQFSLLNPGADPDSYVVAIKLDAASRGGSRYIFDELRVGDALKISAPRNNFPLVENAEHVVLFAGGIGITPIWCMAQELDGAEPLVGALLFLPLARRHGVSLDAREIRPGTRASAFRRRSRTENFSTSPAPSRGAGECAFLLLRPQPDARRPSKPPPRAGRGPMCMWNISRPKPRRRRPGGFWVELARSGEEYYIPEGKKILEVLYEAGIDVDYSCELGICGECVTRVISGIPEHRDSVLSEEEQAANDKVMICCAGCKSERLVLDM